MSKFTTCLWFDHQGLEAAEFYCSVFDNSRVLHVAHYSKAGFEVHGRPEGSVMPVAFELEGQPFLALNGGPHFTFTPAISMIVNCDTQAELDALWARLSAHPEAEQCGWLKDRFGLSWQLVPRAMGALMTNGDDAQRDRIMRAMLRMKKIDIGKLQEAAAG